MATNDALEALYRRPGFLVRRVHQVAISLFDEECSAFGVTNTQHGLLQAVQSTDGVDVVGAARLVGIDRTTAHVAVANLERNGWIKRTVNPSDRRSHLLSITAAGRRLLKESHPAIQRAQRRLLARLSEADVAHFVDIMERIAPPLGSENGAASVAKKPRSRAKVR